jgi:hypothetical protein
MEDDTYISTVHASLSLHVVLHTTVLLYTARNCHDEIVRQLPKATGIAGASRREELASVVQEGSFLRILFPRGVHVVVVVTATVVASFGLCCM